MLLAHVILGKVAASIAAAFAVFHPDLSIWWALALYVIVGNLVCIVSAAVVLLLAARGEADDANSTVSPEPQLA